MCPTEFRCSVFADGELPEAEAREVAMHLETCATCNAVVESLQSESRMLVQCLQDVAPVAESVPEFQAAPEPVSVGRFALVVMGVAVAFRLSTGILFGLELPPGMEWLSPQQWVLNLGVGVNAAIYAFENGRSALTDAAQTVAILAFAGLVLAATGRALKHGAATGAMLSVLVAMGFLSSPGYAIDVRKGASASLPAGETVDDTLIVNAGGSGAQANKDIQIAGTVKGDLIAAGDVITISGTVEGNVLALGRRIEITGTVGGNVVTASQNVTISGKVGGSVIGAGSLVTLSGEVARNFVGLAGNVALTNAARVSGNVALASGESLVEGEILRDLSSAGGVLEFRGSARNVNFRGGQARLTSSARVNGDFTARVENERKVLIDPAAIISGTKKIEMQPRAPGQYQRPGYYFWQVVRLLTAFVTGLIVFRLAPWLAATRIASGTDWLKAGGLGLAALVTVPVAAIIAACTVIGLPLALSSFVLWLAGMYLAKIIVAEFVGRALFKNNNSMSLLAGLALVILAVNLPFLGGLINFLFCLLGLGAIVMTVYRMLSPPFPALAGD